MDSYSFHMDNINQEVARRIAASILHQNRSKKNVAEASGIPLTTFGRKLNNDGQFTIAEVSRIADALSVSPVTLFPPAFFISGVAA